MKLPDRLDHVLAMILKLLQAPNLPAVSRCVALLEKIGGEAFAVKAATQTPLLTSFHELAASIGMSFWLYYSL